MARKMVFIDTSLCTGCKACSVACKAWNDLPAEKTKRIVSYRPRLTLPPPPGPMYSSGKTIKMKKCNLT